MDAPASPDSAPPPDPPKPRRNRRMRASDEAVLTLSRPIANWQARRGWLCAMWGLVPFAGLVLGMAAVILGGSGYRRVRRHPDDLGIRHAVGALLVGAIEIAVNLAGIACIAVGVRQLAQ